MRLLPLLVLFAACTPTPEDLLGLWVNIDEGDVRALECSNLDSDPEAFVYSFYRYTEGEQAAEVQRGTYDVLDGDGPELVTTVTWDIDSVVIGQQFGNPIRKLSGKTLKLEVDEATGDTRTYKAADALP